MARPIVIRTSEIVFPSGKCPCHSLHSEEEKERQRRIEEGIARLQHSSSIRHAAPQCVTPTETSPEGSLAPPPYLERHGSENPIAASRSSRRLPWGWGLRRDSQS